MTKKEYCKYSEQILILFLLIRLVRQPDESLGEPVGIPCYIISFQHSPRPIAVSQSLPGKFDTFPLTQSVNQPL